MNIARITLQKPVLTWLFALVCLVGGLVGYFNLGQLEDPSFTIKQAYVFTPYPGAVAAEVEAEFTEKVESVIQQMPQIKRLTSRSMHGVSEVSIEVLDSVAASDLPQVWDELRKRLRDMEHTLPPGAQAPIVNDDFADVYGIYYAVTGDGLTYRELDDLGREIRKELLAIPGVAKVSVSGVVPEELVVASDAARMAAARISPDEIARALEPLGKVVPAGGRFADQSYLRFQAGNSIDSVDAVNVVQVGAGGRRVKLGDVATVSRGYTDRPLMMILQDGVPAITIGVSAIPGQNIVEVGDAVDARLSDLRGIMPVGTELHPIYLQHRVVDAAVQEFVLNVIISVSIVLVVLCLFMGWRPGLLIASNLMLTIAGTLLIMWLTGIELHRISLGAFIIAMGMLVDNAIVVGEGVLVRLQRGMDHLTAAQETIAQTWWPLLATTVIALLAFAGIGLSPDSTGEFLFSQFAVVAISLLLSWLVAIILTPLFSTYLLKAAENGKADPYDSRFFNAYRRWLNKALELRKLTLGFVIGLLAVAVTLLSIIPQSFFSPTTTAMFTVDILLPQGTQIQATRAAAARVERYVRAQEGVSSVTAFVGAGPERFLLIANPEQPNSAYAQLVVRTADPDAAKRLANQLQSELPRQFAQENFAVKRFVFGSVAAAKIEARFIGRDSEVLRGLAAQARDVFSKNGLLSVRDNWGAKELQIRAGMDLALASEAGVNRADVARAMNIASEGEDIGVIRDADWLVPVKLRFPPPAGTADEADVHVWSEMADTYIPLAAVSTGLSAEWVEGSLQRRNRSRSISVLAEPYLDEYASDARARIAPGIEAIQLPKGYRLEWGGEFEGSEEANDALIGTLAVPYLLMLLLTIALFGRLKQPLIIWLTVPMAVIGVVAGLLITGLPFAFMSFLGLLSLTGMLIKNSVVLVDEIDRQISQGVPRFSALIEASVSRLRPVILAAGTTLLGVVPLLWDAFFQDMAATIIGGLAFASALTLFVVPCLYAMLFRIKAKEF